MVCKTTNSSHTNGRTSISCQEFTAVKKLNAAITFRDPYLLHHREDLKLDFKSFLAETQCELDYFHNLLCCGHTEILLHPLYLYFLHKKWDKIKLYQLIRLIFYFIFVVLLSLYVLTGHVANCEKYDEHFNHEEQFTICKNSSIYGTAFKNIPISSNTQWFVLLFCIFWESLRKLYGIVIYPDSWEYLKNFENIFEWVLIFLVIIISSIFTGRMFIWQSYLGSLTLLLGWINLMFIVGEFSFFHSYIDMYKQVIKRCLKLCILFGFPLFGSAICFCIIFPYSSSLSNLIQGLIITLTMMTGEVDTDLLQQAIPKIGYWIWAQIIFILFIFFITVCNMNLVVAVIVGDLEKLEETALLSKVERLTKMIWNLEMFLRSKTLRWLKKRILIFPRNDFTIVVKKKEVPKKIWVALYEIATINNNNNNNTNRLFSNVSEYTHI